MLPFESLLAIGRASPYRPDPPVVELDRRYCMTKPDFVTHLDDLVATDLPHLDRPHLRLLPKHPMRALEALDDPRFKLIPDRVGNREPLVEAIEARLAELTVAEVVSMLEAVEVPVGPIYSLDQVFEDPQTEHLKLKRTIQHPTLENDASFSPWICKIARHRAHDLLRKRRRNEALPEEESDNVPAPEPGALDSLLEAEQSKLIAGALQALPKDSREAMIGKMSAEPARTELTSTGAAPIPMRFL